MWDASADRLTDNRTGNPYYTALHSFAWMKQS
jgi:hypothetical protein